MTRRYLQDAINPLLDASALPTAAQLAQLAALTSACRLRACSKRPVSTSKPTPWVNTSISSALRPASGQPWTIAALGR